MDPARSSSGKENQYIDPSAATSSHKTKQGKQTEGAPKKVVTDVFEQALKEREQLKGASPEERQIARNKAYNEGNQAAQERERLAKELSKYKKS